MVQYGIHRRPSLTPASSQLIPVKIITFYIPIIHSNFVSPISTQIYHMDYRSVEYPKILFGGGGGSTNSVEDRGQGSGGGNPLVRGSGGSCNLVQEISFHIVKFS